MLCIKISMLMIISMISLEVNKIKCRKDIDEGNYLFGVVLFTIFYSFILSFITIKYIY